MLRPGPVADPRWETFVRSFEQTSTARALLLVLGRVELTAIHRRALTRALGDRQSAAIVDSVGGHELITALTWSGVTIESFPLSHLREALGSLDPESEGESIEQCLDLAARLIGLTAPGVAA